MGGEVNDGCDAWFQLELPPRVAPLRVYCRPPRQGLAMFEVEQVGNRPIETAIDMVRNDMKVNAMVLIK